MYFACFIERKTILFIYIDDGCKSSTFFPSEETASADARKKNSVRYRLINLCESEFDQSTRKEGKYAEFEEQRRVFESRLATMTQEEKMEEVMITIIVIIILNCEIIFSQLSIFFYDILCCAILFIFNVVLGFRIVLGCLRVWRSRCWCE